MRIDQTVFGGGGVAVLIWAAASASAFAQETDWIAGVAVELAPARDISVGLDSFAHQEEAQHLDRALFNGADGLGAVPERGVWRRLADGALEQIRIRSAHEPSPLPEGSIERARFEAAQRDVAYIRAWPMVSGEAGDVQVELTPHAGVGVNALGGTAEAGATIRVGRLEVSDGEHAYAEDEGRWYLFAAGTGTAVGLNWARGMDGWNRQISHDTGSFIGDAQIGVAWRRGDTQTSFGYVHREITADGVHGGTGIDRDATEGFVAVQFSIRPDW